MNQLSYYVTKRLIVGSKDSSGTIINDIHLLKLSFAACKRQAAMPAATARRLLPLYVASCCSYWRGALATVVATSRDPPPGAASGISVSGHSR